MTRMVEGCSLEFRKFLSFVITHANTIFRPFMTGSEEKGWYRLVSESAFTTLVLLHRSLSAHPRPVFH